MKIKGGDVPGNRLQRGVSIVMPSHAYFGYQAGNLEIESSNKFYGVIVLKIANLKFNIFKM